MSKQLYSEQFGLALARSLNVSTVWLSKTFLFQAIPFNQTVLIRTIQFSISMQLVLFKTHIGPYQVQQFRARVELGVTAMKACPAFPKARASLEPYHQIV